MTIGETLKRARKKQNMDLNDVAKATKIAKMFLIALESDDVSKLPTGIYIRHFLRTYAKYLKLDEDIITAEYYEQFSIKPHFVLQQEQTKADDQQFRVQKHRLYLFLLFVIVTLSLLVYFFRDPISEYFETGASIFDTPINPADNGIGAKQDQSASSKILSTPAKTAEPGQSQAAEEKALKDVVTEAAPVTSDIPKTLDGDQPLNPEQTIPDEVNDAVASESANDPPIDAAAEPERRFPPQSLPIVAQDLASVQWTPPGQAADRLEDMFALEGLGKVWLKVVIDGEIITERHLDRGDVRYFRYGDLQSVHIGDPSMIAIQDGAQFLNQADSKNNAFFLDNFGPGKLLESLTRAIQRRKSTDE